ncbi:MAG: isoaspartyl peptidase/L-asparaginase [Candidatus Krumholzibacteria bacterium]
MKGIRIQLTVVTMLVLSMVLTGCVRRENDQYTKKAPKEKPLAIVIHGGAGTILKENMTPEREKAYTDILTEVLQAGYEILEQGGSSLDAVEGAIRIMEDSPLFNAGKGAVFTNQGKNELDASIMDGATLQAGAVTSVTIIKNPITAARLVMTDSKHVLLAGRGAELFAGEHGLETVDPDYFFTQRRWDSLLKAKERDRSSNAASREEKFGTVGVVALDKDGNLAAGTSTGGLTNKLYGRVGDSPIIGAGSYANNKTCAVSGTGQGEYFMRNLVAYDVSVWMEHEGMSAQQAADKVIQEKLTELGGTGGVIVLDKDGNVAMSFNTEGMYRGFIVGDGVPHVSIYGEAPPSG